MGELQGKKVRAGYRTAAALLLVGLTSIGFTRFEDRAVIGAPGSPASAMAAVATTSSTPGETYAGAPSGSVALSDASRAPANRIRRILQDRSVPNFAARQILTPGTIDNAGVAPAVEPGTTAPSVGTLAPIETTPTSFGSLPPALPGQGTPLFAAALPSSGGGAGGGGVGGGGAGGGDGGNTPDGSGTDAGSPQPNPGLAPTDVTPLDPGPTNPDSAGNGGADPTPTPVPTPTSTPTPVPVSPVPEPGTWLMLMMGLFAIGASLRFGSARRAPPSVSQAG